MNLIIFIIENWKRLEKMKSSDETETDGYFSTALLLQLKLWWMRRNSFTRKQNKTQNAQLIREKNLSAASRGFLFFIW